jgi:hypothetical protein
MPGAMPIVSPIRFHRDGDKDLSAVAVIVFCIRRFFDTGSQAGLEPLILEAWTKWKQQLQDAGQISVPCL